MKSFLSIFLLLLFSGVSGEWEIPKIRGLWILKSDAKSFYGSTNFHGNWHVAQWSIPEDLGNFKENKTNNKHATVSLSPNNIIWTRSSGAELPCGDEFDLLFSPMALTSSKEIKKYKSLVLKFDFKINDEYIIKNNNCKITQKGNLVGIILRNDSKNEVFFYQLWIKRWPKEPYNPYWARKGEEVDGKIRYLLDDNLSSFGKISPGIGDGFVSYEIELYNTILSYMYETEIKNPEEWKITGVYFGSAIWGGVVNKTAWKNMELIAK